MSYGLREFIDKMYHATDLPINFFFIFISSRAMLIKYYFWAYIERYFLDAAFHYRIWRRFVYYFICYRGSATYDG